MTDAFLSGLAACLGLIVAIGAQNAFLLRQGIIGEHVLAVCATCALSDVVLISAGVAGFGRLAEAAPWLTPALEVGGALFLFAYGARSLRAALRGGEALMPASGPGLPLGATLATCLAFTWLNPHVWLDTVVLLGALSLQHPGAEGAFAVGAIAASSGFLFTLGYGAAWLRPLFARPAAWQALEAGVALVMWALAVKLLLT